MEKYSYRYFDRFQQTGKLKHFLLEMLVDRRQPIYSLLRRKFHKQSFLLDYGCGSGLFGKQISPHIRYEGMDISRQAVVLAKKNIKMGTVTMGSEKQLGSLKALKYDVITCFDVLEHVKKVQVCLHEFHRTLKDDGWCVICVPVPGSMAFYRRGVKWIGFEDITHVRLWSRTHWSHVFEDNGFLVIKIFSAGIVNSPTLRYQLQGWLKIVHYITQGFGVLGVPLPSFFSDEDYFVLIKNPYLDST